MHRLERELGGITSGSTDPIGGATNSDVSPTVRAKLWCVQADLFVAKLGLSSSYMNLS